MPMTADELNSWRKGERARLVAARESLDAATLERFRQRLDGHLRRSFPGLAPAKLATARPRRAGTALPGVVGPRQPLVFREWHPGVALKTGPLGISYPAGSDPVVPTAML